MRYNTESVMARLEALKLPEKDKIVIGLLCQIRDLLMVQLGELEDEDNPLGL